MLIYILIFILFIALAYLYLRIFSLYKTNKNEHYTVFIGLNDKDTDTQLLSYDQAVALIDRVVLNHCSGYTVSPATGRWFDANKQLVCENSIICYFDNIDVKTFHLLLNDLIEVMNQHNVFVNHYLTSGEYYYGKNK